ncbi:hypothetical protein M3Y96_01032500 [Aphelenchoides besseyi]|nr:hypothetical protein M3Y96_01032500 [Aphelenchoides besseyi]
MIADGSDDLRLELCPFDEDHPEGTRRAEDLVPLILKHVELGSIICTDACRAYNSLDTHGYVHQVVNHSDPENPFVTEDGVHTNRIKSSWRPLKDYFRTKRVPHSAFKTALMEYQWRRHCRLNSIDPFDSLIEAIKATHFPS